jgi:hypothetical protein
MRARPDRTLRGPFILGAARLMTLTIALWPAISAADDKAAAKASEPPPNKLTVAYYAFSSGIEGVDVNLRHTFTRSTAWVGGYRQSDRFDQARGGYEYDYRRDWLAVVPSVQAASHGFVGVTLYGEAGRSFVGIAGFGRTNLHPYWNLSFDPNDFIQFGVGYHDHAQNTMSLYAIRDNRLGTGQTNTHAYLRHHLHDWRLTVDVVREHGRGDDGLVVRGWAASVEADRPRWFVRVAEDPRVNYTPDRQWRIATGTRF